MIKISKLKKIILGMLIFKVGFLLYSV